MKTFRKWLWDSGADLAIIPILTIGVCVWFCAKFPPQEQPQAVWTITITVTQ